MAGGTFLLWIAVFGISLQLIAGACTIESALHGSWISSTKNAITINSSYISGYSIYGKGDFDFGCELISGDKYIFKSEQFQIFNDYLVAVMCITFTQRSSSLFTYVTYTAELGDAQDERVRYVNTLTTITEAVACTDTSATDYAILMTDGAIDTVKSTCAEPLLGKFSYSYGESDCANMSGSLDVCSDTTKMSFNLTACSTTMAFSTGGELTCVYTSSSGNVHYQHVYNMDNSTDESTKYRFTCYVAESSNGYVYATESPKDCYSNQTSTYVPGQGSNLTLLASVTCVPATTTAASTAVSSASLVAGVVAGLLVLIILAILIVAFCIWKKKKERVDPIGTAPIDTGMRTKSKDIHKNGDNGVIATHQKEANGNGFVVTSSSKPQVDSVQRLHDALDVKVDNSQRKLPPLVMTDLTNQTDEQKNIIDAKDLHNMIK